MHWVDRPDQKEMAAQQRVLKTMEKGRRRQFRTTLDKSEHPRVRSNHSEIMETFGGKETELVLAIQQGEHLGGLQVSKGVPQGLQGGPGSSMSLSNVGPERVVAGPSRGGDGLIRKRRRS